MIKFKSLCESLSSDVRIAEGPSAYLLDYVAPSKQKTPNGGIVWA